MIVKAGKTVPLQAWSGPEVSMKLRFPDFTTTSQDGVKFSLKHRPPLPPGNSPGTHFCYRLSRPQGHSAIGRILCQWKIPMTPAGIEPATLRFVAQHLNRCATAVPRKRLCPCIIQYIFYFLEVVSADICKMIYDFWFRDNDNLHNFRILWFIGDSVSIWVVCSCTRIGNGLIGKDVREC